MFKKYLMMMLAALTLSINAYAAGAEQKVAWDKFPTAKVSDMASLQVGAKLFVNYCLNCHEAAFMRFNRLRDIGLTDEEIKGNLLFTSENVGDMMKVAMRPKDSKAWLGKTPPDLTLMARSRASHSGTGADYLYNYLRHFYWDTKSATGWNNLVFPAVGMPHALWELQGKRTAVFEGEGAEAKFVKYETLTPGKLSEAEFNNQMADLVAFMQWMGEPAQLYRQKLGMFVLIFLLGFFFVAWRLNASYWKDIK